VHPQIKEKKFDKNGSGFPSRFSLYDPRESLLQTKENCHAMFLIKIITALLQLSPSP